MNSVKVITTLHEDGYNLYGNYNLTTWAKYFPSDWEIVYYAEKHFPQFSERIEVIDFNEHCPEWNDFYQHIKSEIDLSQTSIDEKRINWYKKALRWSFKMYALLHALKNTNARYLIWLDADVVATAVPPDNWINSCIDGKCLAGQLEYVKGHGHIETGIILIDLNHPDVDKLYNWIKLGYVEKKILEEDKAWDGIWIAKLVLSNNIAWNNLQMVIQKQVARAFSNNQLHWLHHRVGKFKFKDTEYSKRSGRSPNRELI